MKEFLLIGKPNSGKTSLFNLITGLNQKIGNYSGVTVEKKSGTFEGRKVIDLPGLRSLKTITPEELITKSVLKQAVSSQTPVLFVANGMLLEDNLMLYSEIADLQIPMMLAVTFKDDLESSKVELSVKGLRDKLGCPVILINARKGDGIEILIEHVNANDFVVPNAVARSAYDKVVGSEMHNDYKALIFGDPAEHAAFVEDDYFKRQKIVNSISSAAISSKPADFLKGSKQVDKWLLHPIIGMIIFLFVLYLVFQSVFALASFPMDWIDGSITSLSSWVKNNMAPGWLNDIISDALIMGIGGVVIFIPQIAILFFMLGILEQTGYLSRISFLSDAFLRKFGLSGKSVIPLMSSWACAIPAIMGTRVINDPKERLAVIMASPLMTCSARLPVYTILIAVIIPSNEGGFFGAQGLALLALYLLGVVATLVVAWIVSRRSDVASNPYWSLELPVYRMPNWRNIFITVFQKTKSFVVEAGKVILAISIVLWVLASFSPKSEDFIEARFQEQQSQFVHAESLSVESVALEYSYLGYLGKVIEPVIKPLGYDWKIGIALITSFAAREVFVGTLSTIYSIGSEEEQTIVARLQGEKVKETGEARFSIATSVSLLLFYVFALQCMSTVAIVRKELDSWKYAIFQFIFMLVLAYVFALFAYQFLN